MAAACLAGLVTGQRSGAAEPYRSADRPADRSVVAVEGQHHWPWRHADPNDPLRYVGWGEPLQGTSWRNRPFHMGWAVGALLGDQLIDGRLDQGQRVLGAYRLGWDFDHYWGSELRFAFAYLDVIDASDGRSGRDARHLYWDGNLLYYPWGDARWRPYVTVGLGVANIRFQDQAEGKFHESLLGLPFGMGLKYQARKWLAWRLEVKDNLVVSGAGLSTMHNLSITGGVEVHFGNHPTSYYPWNPGVHYR
jgi:hypothetical protein